MLIEKEFRSRPYSYFYNKVCEENYHTKELYDLNYEPLRKQHPKYKTGWHHSFFEPHRYMNWIIYAWICENFSRDILILDIGCYDGMLVKILNNANYFAYGFDNNRWDKMWGLFHLSGVINQKMENADIAVMFNFHHNFKPSELFGYVKKRCGGSMPQYLFMDREISCPHPYNKLYYNKHTLADLNIKIAVFTECNKHNKWTCRELMIWENKNV